MSADGTAGIIAVMPRSALLTPRYIVVDLGSHTIRGFVSAAQVDFSGPAMLSEVNKRGAVKNQSQLPIVQRGRIVDSVLAKKWFQRQWKLVSGLSWWNTTVLIATPIGSSVDDLEIISELFSSMGGQRIWHISQPQAAAIGSGISPLDSLASLMVTVGANLTQAALVELGECVAFSQLPTGGRTLLSSLESWLNQQFSLQVGPDTLDQLLQSVANLSNEAGNEKSLVIVGQDMLTGRPRQLEILTTHLMAALEAWAKTIVQPMVEVMESGRAEQIQAIMERGVLLAGGAAQLPGLADFISAELQVPVSVVEEPKLAVLKGLKRIAADPDLYSWILHDITLNSGLPI